MDIIQLNLFEQEIWKPVAGWEDKYEISSEGRLKNLLTQKILNGWLDNRGYRCVTLGHSQRKKLHTLVLESFVSVKPSLNHCCNHIDGNKINNCLENLEWVSYSENNFHAYRTGLKKPHIPNSERMRNMAILQSIGGMGNTKLNPEQVKEIRTLWATGKYSMRVLGKQFNISHNQISSLLKGKTYTWVN